MEIQWNQADCNFLQRDLREIQNLEQIQEVRLTDGMPDIGRVLCAWGQCVLRSKEWRNDAVLASGGVNAWVLYAPEDGSQPQCVEVWLPFQGKWNLSDSRREGVIRLSCCLRLVDARTLSSRKIMVRASVGMLMEAMESAQESLYRPSELPEGVQLLEKTYPVMLPTEAGEKLFMLEEELELTGDRPQKILCCQVHPTVTEPAVIGSRAVFRGSCTVQLLCMTENGKIIKHTQQIPFAQYGELDRDYDKEANISVMMAVSNLEPEISESGVHIKCGLIAQYMIFDRKLIQVAEDAYSPWQPVQPITEQLQLPTLLDVSRQLLRAEGQIPAEASRVVDVTFFPDQPTQFREGQSVQSQVGGCFQVLYYDMEGNLQCATENWSGEWSFPAEESSRAFVQLTSVQPGDESVVGGHIMCDAELILEAFTVCGQPIPMLSGIQVGEKNAPDPNRPSLILRRMGEDGLWNMAKKCGSTVEAIEKANNLTGEPSLGQMLLIPIT